MISPSSKGVFQGGSKTTSINLQEYFGSPKMKENVIIEEATEQEDEISMLDEVKVIDSSRDKANQGHAKKRVKVNPFVN